MRFYYYFIFIFSSVSIFAQTPDDFLDQEEYLGENYGLSGHFWSNSNTIPSAIGNSFTQFGNASQKAADHAVSQEIDKISLGFSTGFKLFANLYLKPEAKEKKRFTHFSFEQKIMGGGVISNDAMRLLLRGNKQFENETAFLDDSKFRYFDYQSLKTGFIQYKENYSYGLNIGFVAGKSFANADINALSLFTAPFGEYLDINSDLMFIQNNSNSYYNGFGGMVDLFYQRKMNDKFSFGITATDIGFINWNNKTNIVKSDTSFRFDGIAIDDLFSFNSEEISIEDTLRNYIIQSEEERSSLQMLPFNINLQGNYCFSEKYLLSARISYISNIHQFVLFHVNNRFQINEQFNISAGLMYGGSGLFNTSLALQYQKERFLINLGTLINEGFINSSQWKGNGLMLKLVILTSK